MHQTKKGNEWRFGMKCHIGVDAGTGYVHTVTATPANVHDITETAKLIREDDEVVYGDSGYVGIQKRTEIKEDEHLSKIDYRITRRPSSLPKVSDNAIDWERYIDNRNFRKYLTMQLIGKDILTIASLLFVPKWNTHLKSSKEHLVLARFVIVE